MPWVAAAPLAAGATTAAAEGAAAAGALGAAAAPAAAGALGAAAVPTAAGALGAAAVPTAGGIGSSLGSLAAGTEGAASLANVAIPGLAEAVPTAAINVAPLTANVGLEGGLGLGGSASAQSLAAGLGGPGGTNLGGLFGTEAGLPGSGSWLDSLWDTTKKIAKNPYVQQVGEQLAGQALGGGGDGKGNLPPGAVNQNSGVRPQQAAGSPEDQMNALLGSLFQGAR